MVNKFRAWLAFYVVTLSFIFIFSITLIPEAQGAETNNIILGFLLATGLASILAFYFGSSDSPPIAPIEPERGTDDKDKI